MFLYFLPDVTRLTPEVLTRFGLATLLGTTGDPIDASVIGGGVAYRRPARPGESAADQPGSGYVCGVWHPSCPDPRLDGAQQLWTWIPAAGDRPEYAVGYWKSAPPTPTTLARSQIIPGHSLRLADGQEWTAPVARTPPNQARLPLAVRFEGTPEAGQVVTSVVPAWEWLWELSGIVWTFWFVTGRTMTLDQTYHWAVRALAANYRVGPVECGLLGILTTETINDILATLIDAPRFVEFFDTPQGAEWVRELGLARLNPDAGTGAAGEPAAAEPADSPPAVTNTSPGPPEGSPGIAPVAPN